MKIQRVDFVFVRKDHRAELVYGYDYIIVFKDKSTYAYDGFRLFVFYDIDPYNSELRGAYNLFYERV